MSDEITKAAQALLAQVNAYLDYEEDETMAEAAEALTDSIHETGQVDPDLARTLLDEVDATLDYEEDDDMSEAADTLRELLPAPAPAA